MSLTEQEGLELVRLLGKLKWPLRKDIFHALVQKTVTVPQELAVIDDQNRIFLIYREDEEYVGHHHPGTVLRANESVSQAVKRLLDSELPGIMLESIKNIGWIEIPKGKRWGENSTRHEVSLLWLARVKGYAGVRGMFFSLNQIPENTLTHHKFIIAKVREHLETGRLILGR